MTPEQVERLISFVGACVQAASAALLCLLFHLLRRHAERRAYFATWTRAWMVLLVAMAAVVLLKLPSMLGLAALPASLRAPLLFTYQLAKLVYAGLLVVGTRQYAYGQQSKRVLGALVAAAVVYAALPLTVVGELWGTVIVQAPFVVGAFAYCAAMLLGLPQSRRSIGSRASGSVFAAVAVVWALYLVVFFRGTWRGWLPALVGPLTVVQRFNPYFDALLQMLLACGMLVLLMEDERREADDAHAELAVAHDKLRRDALYDSLTGSLNRRAFTEGVGLEMVKATFGAVIVLDMDNLKQVNDAGGHAAGDELLQHLVATLRGVIRPSDRLYRWGGDEFLLVFPGARSADVQARVEQAIAAAEVLVLPRIADPVPLVASVGAADYASAEDLAQAIERADGVMYRQKKARRAQERGVRETTPVVPHEKFVKA